MKVLSYYRAVDMEKLGYYKALEILEKTLKDGGYSRKEYDDGYMVALEGSGRIIDISDNGILEAVHEIVKYHDEFNTINTRLKDNILHLDVLVNIEDIRDAIKFGWKNNQIEIYDCVLKETIDIT